MKIIPRIVSIAVVTGLFVWGFFTVAGRWDWMAGWWYLGLLVTTETLNDLAVWRWNPGLLTRRGRFGAGTETWDYVCLGVFGLSFLAVLVVGALDSGRYGWSAMPPVLVSTGALLHIAGQSLLSWAMVANPFFEKTARLQREQGQRVVDRGPYRFVRHPGYLGTIVGFVLGTPLLLGSWWAFVPAILAIASLIIRTALEDRMLACGLPGYAAYSGRVAYRLIPKVW